MNLDQITGDMTASVQIVVLITIALAVVLTTVAVYWIAARFCRGRRSGIMDEMEGHDFEYFCADLLEKQGFVEVEVTRGSGDFGVDILAEKTVSVMLSSVNDTMRR